MLKDAYIETKCIVHFHRLHACAEDYERLFSLFLVKFQSGQQLDSYDAFAARLEGSMSIADPTHNISRLSVNSGISLDITQPLLLIDFHWNRTESVPMLETFNFYVYNEVFFQLGEKHIILVLSEITLSIIFFALSKQI